MTTAATSNVTSIGDKVQAFYLTLYHPPGDNNNDAQNLDALVECMHELEYHRPVLQLNENREVVDEIVKDCRKKCAQYLRSPYAESIRGVIAACRKRLVTKAALDSEASYQHNQRHLNTLIELLGSWSNIVAQCSDFGFSRSLTRQILSPLYTRIVEASVECFKTFKRDKELDQWSVRLLDETAECNVGSLDFLVSQVAAMKSMVHQHYAYHYSTFHDYDPLAELQSGAPTSAAASTDGASAAASSAIIENMLIVTQDELLQWRELDALYVTMEFGFLQRATQQALRELQLIETEAGVLIPQCVEDVFFVLRKVCERALGTGSESNLFSVGNRVLELVRYTAPDEYDRHSMLYRVVTSKAFYRKCAARKEASGRALQRILDGPASRSRASNKKPGSGGSSYSTPSKPAPAGRGLSGNNSGNSSSALLGTPAAASSQTSLAAMLLGGSDENGYYSGTLPSSPAALGIANAITDVAAVSLTGMNWWLADQLSPYLSGAESAAGGNEAQGEAGSRGSSANLGGIAMQITTPEKSAGSNQSAVPGRPLLPPTAAAGAHTPAGKAAAGHSSSSSLNYSPPSSANGKAALGSGTGSAPTSNKSALGLDELLLSALVGDDESDTEDVFSDTMGAANIISAAEGVGCVDGYDFSVVVEAQRDKLALSERDWVVQINTLSMVAGSLATLQGVCGKGRSIGLIYSAADRRGGGKSSGPTELLMKELSGCQAQYTAVLDAEARQLARWTFLSQMLFELNKFCARRFEIGGQEMEDRGAELALCGIARRCLGVTAIERYRALQERADAAAQPGANSSGGSKARGTTTSGLNSAPSSQNGQDTRTDEERESEAMLLREAERAKHGTFLFGCESKLSQGAYVVVLRELCGILAAHLFEQLLLRAKFSEWGALLLYQEVIATTQYMEELVDHLDNEHVSTVKQTFAALNLALKLLTLDAPGDIRRYALDRRLLTEEQVRAVLGRRVDFSAEAVAKVKLSMI